MKVSTRLALGFGVLLSLTAVSIGMALFNLRTMNAQIDTIVDNRVPKMMALDDIAYRSMDNARIVRNLLLLKNPQEMNSEVAAYEANVSIVDKQLAFLDKSIVLVGDQELLKAVEGSRTAFRAYSKEVMKLSLAGKQADAKAALYGADFKTQEIYLNAVRALRDSQQAKVQASGSESGAVIERARIMMLALGALALLAGVAIAVMTSRSLLRQLGGEPSQAAEVVNRLSAGDLTVDVTTRDGDTTSVMAAMKSLRNKLAEMVGGVRSNADGVATASAQIAQGNNDLSSRTEEQASALQQTAASMKELAGTVKQNADNAHQGNRLAQEASNVAVRGGEVVSQVVETMKGINDSSRKIADIISVIDGIAFQTNILALNAAVEAARAGEQGRGFAVVASEVRSLAQRSADAAREIKNLITASVERVEQGSALVDQAGATMSEVVQSIRAVTDLMADISTASNQQSEGVAQIGDAVNQMDMATQQNAALVEESAAAADSLKGQAQQLVGAVSIFKLAGGHGGYAAANMDSVVSTPIAAVNSAKAAARPAFKSAPAAQSALRESQPVRTGTDDDWTSF
ncbi:MAG: MCP four helix bundle domain-containing protein [Ramlibacter sp.]|nr:MCP four helix bundle domain-containing protein [Ramlibacter sp.]